MQGLFGQKDQQQDPLEHRKASQPAGERQSLLDSATTTTLQRHQDRYNSLTTTPTSEDVRNINDEPTLLSENNNHNTNINIKPDCMPKWTIACILSTAFSYGCILTTLFLITLPVECERIHTSHPALPKSVALGVFVAIAGITQLISPIVGHASDVYRPSVELQVGQRLPYHVFGAFCTTAGLLGQLLSSTAGFWLRYGLAFFLHMIGLNIQYSIMLALLADQIPDAQIGQSNGILALLLVTGSLFGFGLFHSVLSQDVHSMYGLYTCIVIVSSILTGTHAQDMDVALTVQRIKREQQQQQQVEENEDEVASSDDDDLGALEEEEEEERGEVNKVTSPVASPPRTRGKRWRRAAKRAAKQAHAAAKRAQEIIIVTPTQLIHSMFEPFFNMDGSTLIRSYTIDISKSHDFFVVTVSRLFYYCGLSVQTFFLYFVHDIIHVKDDPEAVVALLAIVGQCSGALTCYPVGLLSDQFMGGRRKPFVYLACAILSIATLVMVTAKDLSDMTILCCVLGGANGVYLTMETSLAVDTLPSHFERSNSSTDEEGNAQLLGIWGVAAFLGSALGPMIGGPLLYVFGSQQQDQTGNDTDTEEYTLPGYAVVLSLSSFYFLCSAMTLRYIKKPGE